MILIFNPEDQESEKALLPAWAYSIEEIKNLLEQYLVEQKLFIPKEQYEKI